MSVTPRLLVLVLAVLLPALAAAAWGVVRAHQAQKRAAEQSLLQLAHALAAGVDQELGQRVSMLRTLARAPSLIRGDLASFYGYAQAMAPTAERTIVLSDAQGRQILNTRLPLGAELPVTRNFPELRRRLRAPAEAPLVSNVYFAPVGKRFSFAVQVPVLREGRLLYYLSMGSYGETLRGMLFDNRLQKNWNASIVDREGVLVARRIDSERYVGKPATADMIAHIRQAKEGLFPTVRLDGVATMTAYAPIGDTGWTYVVSMPRAELESGLTRALVAASAIALALVLLGLGVAFSIGRSIAAEFARAGEKLRAVNRDLERRVNEAVAQSRRAQEALLHNQKLEALGRLTGGIAHDFNNLLQTISMAMEIVLHKAQMPAVRAAAESGRRAVQSAVKLTGQLKAFGRASGDAERTVDLHGEVLRLRELIAGALRRDIELAFDFPQALWPVTLDVLQLELALLNAALNARDAMPRGGRLVIGALNTAVREGEQPGLAAGDYVKLTIADSGHGIPPEILPRVFEPFFTTKDVGQGSGLGLAQIYGFATRAGGVATLASDGQGTTLTLWLPRAPGELRSPPPAPGGRALALVERPATVLFVEDDSLVQSVVAPALEQAGFRVLRAGDAEAALQAVGQHKVDVVFSDIVMPGGRSGAELAAELRRRDASLPIVLATGYADTQGVPAGVRVLRKPYLLEDLTGALQSAMKR